MSLHVDLTPDVKARLVREKRISTISSFVISILVIAILTLVLGLFFLKSLAKEPTTFVAYEGKLIDEDTPEVKKVNMAIQRIPSAPSPTSARVIATASLSTASIPVVDIPTTEQSMDFGSGKDFGANWGAGTDFGKGGGEATFFNQNVKAEYVAYVIDYSQSMKGKREILMREELKKSVSSLSSRVKYQLIFFAGPAWVAGDKVSMLDGNKGAEVTDAKGKTYDWKSLGGATNWKAEGKRQQPEWLSVRSKQIENSLMLIDETKLVWGTDWEDPIEIALSMEPTPEVIFFMTDGEMGGRDMPAIVKDLSSQAVRKGVIINTISLMEPKTEKMMFDLARETGGIFTVVDQNGTSRQVDKLGK